MFEGKIALVTGGLGGIGLEYVQELLRNGVQGVTIIDINNNRGRELEETLNKECGCNRVLFVQADVSQKIQLRDAFKTSFQHWNGLDIVVNNAGIINEEDWEKTISLNCGGVVNGTYLGFEYMSQIKGGKGGVIVNMSSVAGTEAYFYSSTYSGTKHFVLAFSRGVGNENYYKTNRVKVITVCPGLTDTPIVTQFFDNSNCILTPELKKLTEEFLATFKTQPASHVAKHVIKLIDTAESGSAWVIEDGEPPYEVYEYNRSITRNKPSN